MDQLQDFGFFLVMDMVPINIRLVVDVLVWTTVSKVPRHTLVAATWEETINCEQTSEPYICYGDGNKGLNNRDSNINPIAYDWNYIHIGYCDGGSFSGHVSDTVAVSSVDDTKLYFKGRYIMDAVYETLLNPAGEFQMHQADEVIISGGSAGGLAVFLHADYLKDKILTSTQSFLRSSPPRVVDVADSGIFVNLPSIHGEYLYTPQYQAVFYMQNVSDSVNKDCIAYYHPRNEDWKCFMTEYTLPFITSDLFISISFADSWEGTYIMGITECYPTIKGSCSSDVANYLNSFRLYQLQHSSLSNWLSKSESGGWFPTCWIHGLVNADYWWENVKVDGYSQNYIFQNWYSGQKDDTHPWISIDGEWGTNSC
jgi:hypothetical protein